MSILDDISPEIPAGTRMTPDMLEPAIGEEYRHRETGRVGWLMLCGEFANMSQINLARVRFPDNMHKQNWYGTVDEFWDDWIHAKARP